jgi:hypothetical protein
MEMKIQKREQSLSLTLLSLPGLVLLSATEKKREEK